MLDFCSAAGSFLLFWAASVAGKLVSGAWVRQVVSTPGIRTAIFVFHLSALRTLPRSLASWFRGPSHAGSAVSLPVGILPLSPCWILLGPLWEAPEMAEEGAEEGAEILPKSGSIRVLLLARLEVPDAFAPCFRPMVSAGGPRAELTSQK